MFYVAIALQKVLSWLWSAYAKHSKSASFETAVMSQVSFRREIVFPRSSEIISQMPASDLFRFAPRNKTEEDEQLHMALSIRSNDKQLSTKNYEKMSRVQMSGKIQLLWLPKMQTSRMHYYPQKFTKLIECPDSDFYFQLTTPYCGISTCNIIFVLFLALFSKKAFC